MAQFAELQQRLLAAQRQLQAQPTSTSTDAAASHADAPVLAEEAQHWRDRCQDLEAEVLDLHAALAEAQSMLGAAYQQEVSAVCYAGLYNKLHVACAAC